MAIGVPVTSKFHIGDGELRIGPMSSANKLTQANSVGLLQNISVKFEQESVDLEGGLPKKLVDTAIVRTKITIEANAHEYSRKNIRVMLNEGVETVAPSEYSGTVAVQAAVAGVGTTDIETTIAVGDVSVGDLIVVYPEATPEKVSVLRVSAVAARQAPNAAYANITIDNTKTPLLFTANVGDKVYKANQIGLGNSSATNYFSGQVVGMEHSTGRPIGFTFWKAAVGGGMEFGFGSDNFAVTPITLKILLPATTEWDGAQDSLYHLRDLIPTHPYGFFWNG